MADCLHQITIDCDDRTLYRALTTSEGVTNWWTGHCDLAKQEGDSSHFDWKVGSPDKLIMRSQKLLPNKRVFLVCTHGPDEWIGTELWWEINPIHNQKCELQFKHMNWHRDDGAFAECNSTWGQLMLRLKTYCEASRVQVT